MFRLMFTQVNNSKPTIIHSTTTLKRISRGNVPADQCLLQEPGGYDGRTLISSIRFFSKHATGRCSSIANNSVYFCRNYAVDAGIHSDKLKQSSNELDDIINELNEKSATDGYRPSQYELKILFNRMKVQKPTAEQALNALKLCSLCRADPNVSKIVKDIWNALHDTDVMDAHELSTAHYNYQLKFASDRRDMNYTQEIFDRMIVNGYEPNATSYECLLAVHSKCGNMAKTKEILNIMDEKQLPISECTFNYMIQCYIISGAVADASEMIKGYYNEKAAANRKFKINRDTVTTVLGHYAKAGDLENCWKIIAMLKTLSIELSNQDVLNLMCDFCANGNADQCDSLFKYFKPDAELHTALHDSTALFVQNNQSLNFVKICAKLMVFGHVGDIKSTMYEHLVKDMCRLNTPATELEATIAAIESTGFEMVENFDTFKPLLKSSSPKLIRRILLQMKTKQMQVSEMVFAKLFELADASEEFDVLDVVDLMCVHFHVQPSTVYVRDVILPAILRTSADPNAKDAIVVAADKLLNTKIAHHRTLNALINSCLNRCDFKTTIRLMNMQGSFYAKKFITETLLNAYGSTGDVQSFVEILGLICRNFTHITSYHPTELTNAEITQRKTAFIDEMLAAAVARSMKDEKRLSQLLAALANANDDLAIDAQQIVKIQQQINESKDMSPHAKEQFMMQINRFMKNLPSGRDRRNLSPGLLNRQQEQKAIAIEHLNAATIKQNLNELLAMGRDVASIEKLLFFAYLQEENIPEVEAMLSGKTTVTGKLNLNNANYAMLVKMYVRHGDYQKAMNMLQQARKRDSTFTLHPMLLAQLIILMHELGQFEIIKVDALLHTNRQEKSIKSRTIPFELLLQRLANDGNAQNVQQLFDALVKFHYIQVNLETAGPLITVHLNNGEYDLAIEKYSEFGRTHKFLPMTGTLFKTLIQHHRNNLLTRALEIHEKVNGKGATMSQLAFAYSECGRIEKAKEIFESGQIDSLTRDVGKVSMRYARRDNLESAKFLLQSTKGILSCDRRPIYQTILDIYDKNNMAEEASELWTEMSNDDVLPTPQFIDKLAKLLQNNQIELPNDLKNKLKQTNCLNGKIKQ